MAVLSARVHRLEQLLVNFWLLSTVGSSQFRIVLLLARSQMVVLHLDVMHLIHMLDIMHTDLLWMVLIVVHLLSSSFEHWWVLLCLLLLIRAISVEDVVEESSYTA